MKIIKKMNDLDTLQKSGELKILGTIITQELKSEYLEIYGCVKKAAGLHCTVIDPRRIGRMAMVAALAKEYNVEFSEDVPKREGDWRVYDVTVNNMHYHIRTPHGPETLEEMLINDIEHINRIGFQFRYERLHAI